MAKSIIKCVIERIYENRTLHKKSYEVIYCDHYGNNTRCQTYLDNAPKTVQTFIDSAKSHTEQIDKDNELKEIIHK